jgi:2,3-bisphosphoglycerate-dependent phosphoglycerate mutase
MADAVFIVRHGEAESNAQKYFAGFSDSPLTRLGQQQAQVLRKRIAHEKIGRAFCSDLSRARGTLEALSLGCPQVFTPELREKNYGELEGLAWGKEEEKFAAHHSDPHLRAPGGESYEDVQTRVVAYFEKSIFPSKEREVLVVSHHGPSILLACHVLQIPLQNWRTLRLGNCGLSIFTREEGKWRLKLWNSLSHFGLESFSPLFSPEATTSKGELAPKGGNPKAKPLFPIKKSL